AGDTSGATGTSVTSTGATTASPTTTTTAGVGGATGTDTSTTATTTTTGGDPPDVRTVQLQEVRQIIRGFGINATIMPGGETLPWDKLFTLDGPDGLGLSILRIRMHEEGGHRD